MMIWMKYIECASEKWLNSRLESLFDLNDLIQLHLLRLFKKLENSFSCQLESSLFLSLVLRLDLWLHLQAHSFARHLLEICSNSTLKSLLFSQSLLFSLRSLSRLLDHLLEMLEIYAENSSKDSLFLRLVSRCVPIFLITHFVAHLATHLLEILAERSPKMPLFPRLDHLLEPRLISSLQDHLLEPFLVAHLATHLLEILAERFSHHLSSHLVAHLQEPLLVTCLEAHLETHLLSRVYSWRIYMSCFIDSAEKNTRRRIKGNASFSSSHIAFLSKSRFRPLSLPHHRVF